MAFRRLVAAVQLLEVQFVKAAVFAERDRIGEVKVDLSVVCEDVAEQKAQVLGLDYHVTEALCYLGSLIQAQSCETSLVMGDHDRGHCLETEWLQQLLLGVLRDNNQYAVCDD